MKKFMKRGAMKAGIGGRTAAYRGVERVGDGQCGEASGSPMDRAIETELCWEQVGMKVQEGGYSSRTFVMMIATGRSPLVSTTTPSFPRQCGERGCRTIRTSTFHRDQISRTGNGDRF